MLGRLLRRQAWELGGVLCCNARKSPSMDTFRLLLSVGWTSWAPESWVQPVSWLLGGVNRQRTCRQRQAPPAASKAMSEPAEPGSGSPAPTCLSVCCCFPDPNPPVAHAWWIVSESENSRGSLLLATPCLFPGLLLPRTCRVSPGSRPLSV